MPLAHKVYFVVSGGLFHPADDKQEVAFRYAVEKINSDRQILPRSKLNAQIEKISPQDSFHASKRGKNHYIYKAEPTSHKLIHFALKQEIDQICIQAHQDNNMFIL